MKIDVQNYGEMRAWMARVAPEVFPDRRPESNPVLVLDSIFAKSRAKARRGLEMAIGDIVEATEYGPVERISAIDKSLKAERQPTLTEMRLRFSKVIRRIVNRGRINDEVEYYAVRNAAELAQDEDALWSLLAAYEEQAAS
jgi:hypothetical protein